MWFHKILILFLLGMTLNAYDGLVNNELYFKIKLNNFGKNRIVAEYEFTTNSSKAVDSNGHGTKMASVIDKGLLK